MSKKFQIFISSTHDDLKEAREEVIKAVLEMGHIPVGMEMFSAADEDQWRTISRTISESDYYIVIVAHRYGSEIEGVSYTEKEYDHALAEGIPVIGFVIDQNASWPASKIDRDASKQAKLTAFREKVMRKPVGFWSVARDLYGKTSIALEKQFKVSPRRGWTRSETGTVVGEQIKDVRKKRFIDISFDHRVISHQSPVDRSYHRTIHTTILGAEEFGTENKIDYQVGQLTSVHVHLGEALNEQVRFYDVFDETQQLMELGEELYNLKANCLSDAVQNLVGGDSDGADILLVDYLAVFSRFRGHGVGLGALYDLMWNFGGINGLVALYADPIQYGGDARVKPDKTLLAEFGVSEVVARMKLSEYFGRLGFKSLHPKSSLMLFSLTHQQQDVSKLGFKGYLEI